MDRNQVRMALLKITLLALGGTTWVFSSFVLGTRPEQPAADALSTLVRLPASLPGQLSLAPTTKTLPPIQMDVMPLNCWDKQEAAARDTSSRWIRLTGKACQADSNAQTVSVRNLSNGYVATVFQPDTQSLTTDFIPLETGRNDILIKFETQPGVTVESQFTLLRQ